MKLVFAIILCFFTGPVAAATDIQTLKTPSGIKVWLVEDHNIPFVAFELRFDGGSGIDPVEKAGATSLMMSLLEEGAGALKVQEFAAAKEALAASFGYGANQDSVSISARFLTENRDEAIALLRQSLIVPRFDADAVERVRAQVLIGLKANKKDPNAIISKAFNDEAYGDHSYGRDVSGTIKTVTGLSIGDLKAAHLYAMVLDRAYVSVVGDITAQELTHLVENLMAGLPDTSPRPLPEQASLGLAQGVQVIDYPTPQSVALFGHAGIDREHPDFFAAYILNQILGGSGFESRLMREIREKRGLPMASIPIWPREIMQISILVSSQVPMIPSLRLWMLCVLSGPKFRVMASRRKSLIAPKHILPGHILCVLTGMRQLLEFWSECRCKVWTQVTSKLAMTR
jgi:zinc protease